LIRVGKNLALRADTCACGDAIVVSRLRPDYGAKEEADSPLAQRVRTSNINPHKSKGGAAWATPP
jgi:hypothetical protein